jgi:hypothetical protein
MQAARVFVRRLKGSKTALHVSLWILATIWLGAAIAGLGVVWKYDNTPGEGAQPPQQWPSAAGLRPDASRPTLVMLAHPHCSCTTASLAELAEVIARSPTRPRTYVLFIVPRGFDKGWEQTDLWRTASSLPDTTVLRDDDGREARQFGAATSGQTLLYDEGGRLVFTGGITGARGHAGDNLGRQSLVALLNRKASDRSATSVFGCSLFRNAS